MLTSLHDVTQEGERTFERVYQESFDSVKSGIKRIGGCVAKTKLKCGDVDGKSIRQSIHLKLER